MKKAADDWVKEGRRVLDYFEAQFANPYRSTVRLTDWLEGQGVLKSGSRVVDAGCGMGETLYYMAQRFPQIQFTGVDINGELVQSGATAFAKRGIKNVTLTQGDFFSPGWAGQNAFDGALSIQTLSWMPEFREPLDCLNKLNTNWLAITSLFFDGHVNVKSEVTVDIDRPTEQRTNYYNTYSLPEVVSYLQALGFSKVTHTPFEIDVDLPRNKPSTMGTYTQLLASGQRLMISGPLLMNWHFILAQR